jgi:acetyl-CoA carboxylase carboxyl transferase subunit beta
MLEDLFKTVKSRLADQKQNVSDKVLIPKDLLFKCPRCQNVAITEDFEANLKVCPKCCYHSRLTSNERISYNIDEGSFVECDADMTSLNPINFSDYSEKIKEAQKNTGLKEAVITGECTINMIPCVVAIMDSHFMMASMGSVVGEKITRAFEIATEKKMPIIIFTASGGARMQEGIISLMQMAKTSGAAAKHNEAGLLYITVLTDPTTGGVTASFASLGDIIIAEPKVLVGFAGRRVIENTIKQHLPDDFQLAEFLCEHGFVDMIVSRDKMKDTLSTLISLHSNKPAKKA